MADLPVCCDDFGRHEVVDAEAVLAGKPAHPPAEGQTPHTGVADQAHREREPVLLGGGDHLGQQRAATDAGATSLRVDHDGVHLAQVDHHAVSYDRVARRPVRATAD